MGFRILILLTLLISACSIIDPTESEPSYVIIDEVKLKNPNGNGFVSHDVTDLWSYLDGINLGVYPYPTHIACLPETNINTFSVIPGIRNNGIASSITIYPMLESLDFELDMEPGESYVIRPEFSYRKDVIIRFDEGFEINADFLNFDADGNSASGLIRDSESAKTGSYSGKIAIPDSLDYVEMATTDTYISIPANGTAVYLELDYKGNGNLFVGLIGYENPENLNNPLKDYYLGLIPSENWKKIYVNLTEPVVQSDLKAYRILFRAEHNTEGEEYVLLDNLKLLHF